MDPEQIYQEVLSDEQGKGSPSAVAEARAKAARQRARHGSPHPKEPRWWPGSQPQFEGGGDGAAPAPAEEEPAAEEAAPEPVAEEATDIGDASQSERPDAPAPAPAAGTETTAPAEPAAAPAAAAVATAPAAAATPARPAGVTHGTDSGNRLRPEDSVGTDAQFDAQKAMADRRRLIDELVATGVPATSAQEAGRPKAPLLLLAYILIPLLAIGYLASSDTEEAAADHGDPTATEAPVDSGPTTHVVAEGLEFDTETITLAAGKPAEIEFENVDTAPHNIAIYEEQGGPDIFQGEQITATTITYEFDAPKAGEYYFQCDVHPDMNGDVVSE